MKITKSWIKKWKPCEEAVEWLKEQDTKDVFELIERLKKSKIEDKYDWLFWALPRRLKTKKDRVRFAVFCAELVLPIFEKTADDKRPRKAIQVAKNWLKNPTKKNRKAAGDAAWAVEYAVEASVWAAKDAVWAAGNAAWTAGNAARAAEYAAWAAEYAAREKVTNQIIDYGVKLLREEE